MRRYSHVGTLPDHSMPSKVPATENFKFTVFRYMIYIVGPQIAAGLEKKNFRHTKFLRKISLHQPDCTECTLRKCNLPNQSLCTKLLRVAYINMHKFELP